MVFILAAALACDFRCDVQAKPQAALAWSYIDARKWLKQTFESFGRDRFAAIRYGRLELSIGMTERTRTGARHYVNRFVRVADRH